MATRTRYFFWFTSDVLWKRLVSPYRGSYIPFLLWSLQAKVVPKKAYLSRLRSPMKSSFKYLFKVLCTDVMSWAPTSRTPRSHGASRPLGMTAAQRYDVPRDWLWDTCHLARACWGTRCKGFCSEEGPHYRIEQSARNPLECEQVQKVLGDHPGAVIGQATINLYSQVWKSLEDSLPKLYCIT